MKTNRPIIDVPVKAIDLIIDLVSVTLLLIMLGYTLYIYPSMSDIIPTHFNGSGEVDGHGSKMTIWLLPFISLIMFIGLFVLNKYPHIHNYMVNITKENALKNYKFSTRALRIVNFLCVVLFSYIQYAIISSTKNGNPSLGSWFLPIVISFSVVLPIILIIYQTRLNKE